jgi:all-trans-retinol 13,14-reductase
MLAFFAWEFPSLAPLIIYHELGMPLANAAATGHNKGGFYGIEITPRRRLSETFNAQASPARSVSAQGS